MLIKHHIWSKTEQGVTNDVLPHLKTLMKVDFGLFMKVWLE